MSVKNNTKIAIIKKIEKKSICIYINPSIDSAQIKQENIKYDNDGFFSLGDFFYFIVEYKKTIDSGAIQTVAVFNAVLGSQTPTALDNEDVWDYVPKPGSQIGNEQVSRMLKFREKTFTIEDCENEGRGSGTVITNDYLIITRITGFLK